MKDILHFHLPRTGGTALRHFLVDQVGEDNVSKPITGMKLRDALLQWAHVPVISGHLATLQGDALPSDRYCITVLRNPIDRFLSEHFFQKHNNASRVMDAALQVSSFDECLARNDGSESNLVQLDMLFPLALANVSSPTAEEKLQAARSALDDFDAVGIQEELEDFALMLCAELGWTPLEVPRSNSSMHRLALHELSPGQSKALHAMLEPELDLYRYAVSRFRRDRRRYLTLAGPASSSRPGEPTRDTRRAQRDTPQGPLEFGDKRCEILSVQACGAMLGDGSVMVGERMTIAVRFIAHEAVERLNVGMAIKDERGALVFGTNSMQLGQQYAVAPGTYEIYFCMLNRLGIGHYTLDAALVAGATHFDGCYHWREQAGGMEVPSAAVGHFIGRTLMDPGVELAGASPEAHWSLCTDVDPAGVAGSFGALNPTLADFRASLQPMAQLSRLRPSADALLQIWASNRGDAPWPCTGRNPVNLSYRWLASNGTIEVADGLRTALPEDVPPALAAIVPMQIRSPSRPGHYTLQGSLVQEQNAWFIDHDPTSGFALPIEVLA
ncbi:Wzt carbohydrate-binding domain-containing protein [Dyella japonica]|uniref:Wzt C-terminal domain-containing protein n=1 Tax=Dyella japonica TaxID=231455 RepID=A0ABV2JVD1_9GAMM